MCFVEKRTTSAHPDMEEFSNTQNNVLLKNKH